MRVAVVLLVTGFAPVMCQAAIVRIGDYRGVMAFANGQNVIGDYQYKVAGAFDLFDASVKAQTAPLEGVPSGHAAAEASQKSWVTSSRISAQGYAWAVGTPSVINPATGIAQSWFQVLFDLTEPSKVELAGTWNGTTVGSFKFFGTDSGFKVEMSSDQSVDYVGELPAGRYFLNADVRTEDPSGSSGSFSLVLNAVALPEPGTLWLAAVAALGVGIAARRRR